MIAVTDTSLEQFKEIRGKPEVIKLSPEEELLITLINLQKYVANNYLSQVGRSLVELANGSLDKLISAETSSPTNSRKFSM